MNTNRKAHHDVLQFTANILEEENYGWANNSTSSGKETGKKNQENNILM